MKSLKVYLKLIRMSVESTLLFRGSLIVGILTDSLRSISTFFVILISFFSFSSFAGYDFATVVFIFMFSHLSYGLCMMFFSSLRGFGDLVKGGGLDTIMLKPVNTLGYICCSSVNIGTVSHIIVSVLLFVLLNDAFSIHWTFLKVLFFIFALISSALIQGAILLIISSMSFEMVDVRGLNNLYAGFREFIWYPIVVYNKVTQFIMLTFIPLGFISFVPTGIFLPHAVNRMLPAPLIYLSPLFGFAVFGIAYRYWSRKISEYHSTGC